MVVASVAHFIPWLAPAEPVDAPEELALVRQSREQEITGRLDAFTAYMQTESNMAFLYQTFAPIEEFAQQQPLPQPLQERVDDVAFQLKSISRLQALNLPREIATYNPACCRFFVETGLVYTIQMCANSTSNGAALHPIQIIDGEPAIMVQGHLQRWSEFRDTIHFDRAIWGFAGWNYISPGGFVPLDHFDFATIYPVEQLDQQQYDTLLQRALSHPNARQGMDCIFQLVITDAEKPWGLPRIPLTKNFFGNLPTHTGMRVITADRSLYSWGFQPKWTECEQIVGRMPWNGCATTNTRISTPDYEESRLFHHRTVTTFPIDARTAQELLAYVDTVNLTGVRLNFVAQNCASLGVQCLRRAGFDVDIEVAASVFLATTLPDVRDIPCMGPALHAVSPLAARIWTILSPLLDPLARKIGIIATNSFLWYLGGSNKVLPQPLSDAPGFRNFDTLLSKWPDLLTELRYASIGRLRDWQLAQPTTTVYTNPTQPRMYL